MLDTFFNYIKYFGRWQYNAEEKLNQQQKQWLLSIQKNGYVKIENFIEEEALQELQKIYSKELEENLNFEMPCLSQSKVDEINHKSLIKNKFKCSKSQLEKEGVTFSKEDVNSYSQVLEGFNPSTLKTYIPNSSNFFNLWLHPQLLEVIEAYMGLRPKLVEAYLRRNFPAKYKVMNHYWHRDVNNKFFLLKAFIFLSDCTVKHGPHEYIAGSVKDRRLDGDEYFTDQQVDDLYPEGSSQRVQSIVKAGTIILEDTRGLHRARTPEVEFRDLGYAVFMPTRIFSKYQTPLYTANEEVLASLSDVQKSYIPKEFITRV